MSVPAPAPGFATLAGLMFVAGLAIPMMAAMNGGLGARLGNPVAAGAILFGIGFALTAALLAMTGLPARAAFASVPWPFYLGGALVTFYILSITFSAPRIGVGNAVFFVLLGQLVAAAAIDQFGWFGALRSELTLRRIAGILIMALGVWLAKKSA